METSFDELLAAAREIYPKLEYEVMEGRPGRDRGSVLDLSAVKAALGWEPKYDLKAALQDYAAEIADIGAF